MQHAVEVETASYLMSSASKDPLWFVLTHGMMPSERLDPLKSPAREKAGALLRSKLKLGSTATTRSPLIVRAYGGLGAGPEAYPNSARLLVWTAQQVGRGHGGMVIERDPVKGSCTRRPLSRTAGARSSG